MNELGVMVLTCDKNIDVLRMFLRNLRKYWPDYHGEVFICTESWRGSIKGFQLKFPTKTYNPRDPWAKRFRDSIKEFNHDYILLLLEDFVFSDYVDDKEVRRVFEIMKTDSSIACFNFQATYKDISDSTQWCYSRYAEKSRNAEFRINLQAALWNRNYLLKFIRQHENPWQFETWGSLRSRRFSERIIHIRKDAPHVFFYPEGGVLADGKWRNESSVIFLESEGFDLAESKRLIYHDGDDRKTEIVHRSLLIKVLQAIRSLI